MKKTVSDLNKADLKGKKVLVRVDFNVPQNKDLTISDDSRIRGALPTIQYLRDAGARVILVSHLGRPKGTTQERMTQSKYSLKPVADYLKIPFCSQCIGEEAKEKIAKMAYGDAILLENVRFHEEEEKNDSYFAKQLADLADLYVNDAFGTAHRAHASTEGVTKYLKPAVAGFLVAKEIEVLSETLDNPIKPFATIIGGAKVSSKIGVLDNLLGRVQVMVIGGAMAFTFLKAMGKNCGKSLVEEDRVDYCRQLLEKAQTKGVTMVLPVDVVIADKLEAGQKTQIVSVDDIPDDKMGLDIGPQSISAIIQALKPCKTILWNGPLGVFEIEGFEKGTYALMDFLVEATKNGAKTIVGGGDSVSALKQKGIQDDQLTHVGTGGGATLEYLEGIELPGIKALEDKTA